MFKHILAASLMALASAGVIHDNQGHDAGHHEHHPKYNFQYAVEDHRTGDIKDHKESRDGDHVEGEYSLIEPDGGKRIVEYSASKHTGFHAVVRKEGGYKQQEHHYQQQQQQQQQQQYHQQQQQQQYHYEQQQQQQNQLQQQYHYEQQQQHDNSIHQFEPLHQAPIQTISSQDLKGHELSHLDIGSSSGISSGGGHEQTFSSHGFGGEGLSHLSLGSFGEFGRHAAQRYELKQLGSHGHSEFNIQQKHGADKESEHGLSHATLIKIEHVQPAKHVEDGYASHGQQQQQLIQHGYGRSEIKIEQSHEPSQLAQGHRLEQSSGHESQGYQYEKPVRQLELPSKSYGL